MANINDISKLSGVSKSTVSRYLNNGSVSKNTAEKIQKVIDGLGYVPNSFAQSLKASKTNIIGTVIPNFIGFSKNVTLTAIDKELKKHNYTTFIANSDDNVRDEVEIMNKLIRQKVDGIILFASEITKAHKDLFKSSEIPIVLIGQKYEDAYCIFHDDFKAGQLIGQYINKTSHKNISYFGVGDYDKSIKNRYLGLKSVLNADKVIKYHALDFDVETSLVEVLNTYSKDKSTFYIGATDNMAYGIIQGLRKLGKEIPQDISVSGFGNYDINNIMSPLLTTVDFKYSEIGEKAVKILIDLIDEKTVEKHTMLDCDLIVRESTI